MGVVGYDRIIWHAPELPTVSVEIQFVGQVIYGCYEQEIGLWTVGDRGGRGGRVTAKGYAPAKVVVYQGSYSTTAI